MEEDQPIDVHRVWEIVRLMQPCDSMHVSLSPLPEGDCIPVRTARFRISSVLIFWLSSYFKLPI